MFPKNFKEATSTGFIPYILEAEGYDNLCTTRNAKINASIKDVKQLVKQGKNPNDYIDIVLTKHGLKEENLTDKECEKIMRCINRTY